MLALAVERAPGHVARARAQQLPVRSGTIGTVLSIFPTPYIVDLDTWHEIERVLRPGGRVIVVDHGWLEPRDPARALLCGLHWIVYGHLGAPPPLSAHIERAGATHALSLLTMTERSARGYVSLHVGQRPR
jgi:hypothetical protein